MTRIGSLEQLGDLQKGDKIYCLSDENYELYYIQDINQNGLWLLHTDGVEIVQLLPTALMVDGCWYLP